MNKSENDQVFSRLDNRLFSLFGKTGFATEPTAVSQAALMKAKSLAALFAAPGNQSAASPGNAQVLRLRVPRGDGIFSRAAFTLVELLVVIAILSILSAMLLPMLSQAIDKARTLACANNLRQVHFAWSSYEEDYRYEPITYVTGHFLWYRFFIEDGYVDESSWLNWPSTAPDKVMGIYNCPSESRPNVDGKTNWNTWKGGHYAINYTLMNAEPKYLQQWASLRNIPRRSDIALMGDKEPDSFMNFWYQYGKSFRHNGGWNVFFLDGHLKYMKEEAVPSNPPDPDSYKDVFYGDARGPGYGWW